jgi:NADH:ubiquinone oxidoreductase subunit F (NADH-binding)
VKSDKQVSKAISKDDYSALQKALSESDDEVTKAVDDS